MHHPNEPFRSSVEGDRHREEEMSVCEVRGSVDGIDVPNQLPGSGLRTFFSDDSVLWKSRFQALANEPLAFEVVLRQQIDTALFRDLARRAPSAHGELPGLARRGLGDPEGRPPVVFRPHEVLHFRGFPASRHSRLGVCTVFTGVSAPKPVKGDALRSP
jgi:hypothetical protein